MSKLFITIVPLNQRPLHLLFLVLLLVSCQREQDWDGAPDIKAKVESEQKTRTSLSVDGSGAGTIYWNPADQIDVFFGSTKAQYTSQNASDAISATFKTSDSVSGTDVSSTNIWGLYPSNSSSSCNGSSITTTLPSTQYGVPNSFDKDIFPAVAHSSSTSLQFYNVCGGIKFNLAYDDIKKITFRGNNNENLAGTVSISFVDDLPKATIVNGVKEITLTPKTGATFTKGADYYFILLPVTLSAGFTMTFTATDGTTGTLNYTDNPVTIKRSIFGKKGNVDVYAAFADGRQPNNVIYYSSSNGQIVTPRSTTVFGSGIVSNEYAVGRGIISFDGDVTKIGYIAFHGCRSLTAISIPHSVTSIGNDTFAYCSLTSFELPNSVTRYSGSLRACSVLESIVVEPGNPSYDSRGGCNAIIETATNTLIEGCKNTVIPNSVTHIGHGAFEECSGLTSIIIPNSVTDIDTYGFRDTGLTSIDIPNSVTSIGYGAFCHTKLTSVSIPASVVSLGRWNSSSSSDLGNPFYGCSDLISINVNPNNPSYDSRNNCNAIINSVTNELVSGCKNTIIPTSISSIGKEAFYYCRSLTSIDIPNSVTSIGGLAFAGCGGMTSIEIPSSVTSIENSAFRDCYLLTSIKINAMSPPTLGTEVFRGTNNCPIFVPAESVDAYQTADGWSEYADRIQAMPSQNNVIYYTSASGQVVTPYKTDTFGANIVSNVYAGGRGVITFDGDVSYIEAHSFYNCADLISIEIPGSVTRIGNYAFSATGLASIEIPDSVTSIGMSAFASTNLTSVEIPSLITSIGTNPFLNCSTLTTITVDSGNSTYDSRGGCNAIIHTSTNELISGCSGTIIPNTVSSIGNNAFYGCEGLTYLEIPNSITSIGNSSFQSCSNLTGVEIPDSVTSIGSSAFYSTGRMSSIIIYAVSPPIVGSSAFAMTNGSPIYVPAQSVNAYKSAWSVYADRIQAIVVHEAVDLGLSVKWATCNVGASTPEEYGDFYAWGETETKSTYDWTTYQWCNGTYYSLTKYNFKKTLGTVDNKTELDLSDDVVHVRWGGNWRMPTDTEIRELWNNCEWTWIVQNGVVGYLVTSNSNGNSIFLPAAGDHAETNVYNQGTQGAYWASSLYSSDPNYACYLKFYINTVYCSYYTRIYGLSIRPVKP